MEHSSNLYIALLHYPVYNKKGDVVTTAVTNMDVHDISRTARTYGVQRFFIVTPLAQQRNFVKGILNHWQRGYGAVYNPSRKTAFDIVETRTSLGDVITDIALSTGKRVLLVATSAVARLDNTSFQTISDGITKNEDNYVLLFGTGWGIAEEVIQRADYMLEPIRGMPDYNHLSVRSAVAIVMDRLAGHR